MAAVISEVTGHFLSVKQVAAYLQLNEKKIYALVNEGSIPATKVTGKWMFPRELIDRWMMDSAHGGLLTDRLVIAGSDDPLIYRVVTAFARDVKALAQVSYTPTGTRLGLDLLQTNRVDVSTLHWGPLEESATRHPALLRQHPQHRNWVLIRAFSREQGLMLSPMVAEKERDIEARCPSARLRPRSCSGRPTSRRGPGRRRPRPVSGSCRSAARHSTSPCPGAFGFGACFRNCCPACSQGNAARWRISWAVTTSAGRVK